ncbi:hypothetical protein H072_4991 [Dactylellina haptotyla CBS 200.50]|uniref:Glucose-methanol-choline oxidoreductase C-terminal domain-containing protein n=1 Tax=Dactylellina haptotyla (strain CBS 200.50) TaxID=1284197 RepID=S8C0K6_DACHA|nr:hypothetical protein H072_4991 [Dactylellina haptotyla CBS 200.50]
MGIDFELNPEVVSTDVLVVGSGPIGATYARKLVDAGHRVLMVDVGAQESEVPGEHKKNLTAMSMNEFTEVVKKDCTPLAPESSLPGAAATRGIGGMSLHWTCATPSPHPTLERPKLFTEAQWSRLISEAQQLINTTFTEFDDSVRHNLVKAALEDAFSENRTFSSIPLACKNVDGKVVWSSSSTVLDSTTQNELFTLLPQHICKKLNKVGSAVVSAEIYDIVSGESKTVKAKQYAICAGAILTPQILFNSGMKEDLPALGAYLTERILTFCQVTLSAESLKGAEIPENDKEVQLMQGVTEERPWQTMIHRDAFQYGEVPEGVDEKTVVDIRAMSSMEPKPENRVQFSDVAKDEYGMPKPSFHVLPNNADLKRGAKMMQDMQTIATKLGSFVTEPRIMPPGTAQHICGTTRAGTSSLDSVVDSDSKVWGVDNLYLGGCGVINTAMACNPTLTAMCFAIAGAEKLDASLRA